MALRLVYSALESSGTENPTTSPELKPRQVFWIAFGALFALKFPTLFFSYNPEELRDFEHYFLVSQGELPFRHFVWFYGGLAPLLYGAILKIFPVTLLTVRIFSLLIWSASSGILSLFFLRENKNGIALFLSLLFATCLMGYPSYSNNHPLATLGLLYSLLHWDEFYRRGDANALWASFAGLMVCFFTRPVLMGYGALAVWSILFLTQTKIPRIDKISFALKALAILGVLVIGFRFLYGPQYKTSFFPLSWAILETKGYPNLHYLFPSLQMFSSLDSFVKIFRGILETFAFYAHYFIWPTTVTLLYSFFPKVDRFRLSFYAMLFGVASSLDLLHYGFNDPTQEQAMRVRGAFFMPFTLLSMALVLLPAIGQSLNKLKRGAAFLFFVGFLLWGYTPWVLGFRDLFTFNTNPFQFKALWGIKIHPDRIPLHSAISFVNNRSHAEDTIVIPQYEPGLSLLLTGKDLFQKDAYAFTRAENYYLQPGETPYNHTVLKNKDLILERIESQKPRFYLVQGDAPAFLGLKNASFDHLHFGPENSTGRTLYYAP